MIMKQRLDELAEIIFGGGPKRLLAPVAIAPENGAPSSPSTFPLIASRRRCCARRSTASPSSIGRISNASS